MTTLEQLLADQAILIQIIIAEAKNEALNKYILDIIIKQLEQDLEYELQCQIDHNLSQGIITPVCDKQFRYTIRGLFYLWRQFIRDMIRLC